MSKNALKVSQISGLDPRGVNVHGGFKKLPNGVSTLQKVFNEVVFPLYNLVFADSFHFDEANFVQYFIDGHWTEWLPAQGGTGIGSAGESEITMLRHVLDTGRIKLLLQDRRIIEVNHASWFETAYVLLSEVALYQTKKRKRGIFVDRKRYANKMRIRIPHK